MRIALLALALTGLLLVPSAIEAAPPLDGARVVEAWPGLAFDEPTQVAHPNDGSDTLYVLELKGVIKRLAKYRGTGPVPQPAIALDLSKTGRVQTQGQGGVLGMAFHPQHKANGRLFLSYLSGTNPNFKLVVSEFRLSGGVSAPATERVVLEVPKSRYIHQAGGLAFGPDGKLYIGVGDNGAKNDVDGNAQNPAVMLGKILRIDVDNPPAGKAYSIPTDNPWANTAGVKGEIWAYGLRNPWRFSFDAAGTLWLGEPGSSDATCREWITAVQKGGNHGWPFMEGNVRNPGATQPPANAQFVPRAFDYGRVDPDMGSCAIGGRVYAGARLPFLKGRYVFADYELGELYALTLAQQGGRWVGSDHRKLGDVNRCVSIDADAQGELYLCSGEKLADGGTVYTLAPK
jgi:glucose/arabinose dehydrogenase